MSNLKYLVHSIIIFCILLLSSQTLFAAPPIFVKTAEDSILLAIDTELPLLWIFTADWCGACNILKQDIHNDLTLIENSIICYIDYDKRKDLTQEYKVKAIPDQILFHKNKEIKRRVGYNKNKTELKEWIKSKP
jgi:thiol-disulfide isomerase/thioredoxin